MPGGAHPLDSSQSDNPTPLCITDGIAMQPREDFGMDDQRFDDLAKRVGTSRRSLLKKMIGLGGAAAVVRLGAGEAEAARRGYSGPSSGPLESDRICTLENPSCCIGCSLLLGTVSTVRQRLNRCRYEQHRTCSDCADSILSDIEGECWVA
jgi:hypothetical protein